MPTNIYQYTDYRLWLKETLDELKKEKFYASYRYVGQKAAIDPGNLVRILQQKTHLSKKAAVKIANFLKLDDKEKAYLDELIVLAKAKTDAETWTSYNKLHELKSVDVRTVADDKFDFFKEWYHTTIRSLLNIVPFKSNYTALAKMLVPPITPAQAKESIELLKRLDLIHQDEDGYWRTNVEFLGTGTKNVEDIKNYQLNHLNLAINALKTVPKDVRDISTLSLSLPQEAVPAFKEAMRDFRKKMMGMAESLEGDDSVYQLNLSFFPSGMYNKDNKEKPKKDS